MRYIFLQLAVTDIYLTLLTRHGLVATASELVQFSGLIHSQTAALCQLFETDHQASAKDLSMCRWKYGVAEAFQPPWDPRVLSNFEPFAAHGLVGVEFGGCALKYDLSMAHHIDTLRYPHGDRQLLFDQQDRDTAPGNVGDQVADLLNNDRCQAFGGLVDHDEFGVAHERAANRQHLLLTARQHTSGGIGARGEVWKHPQHVLEPPFSRTPGILNAKDQVLPHRQARKDIPVFGNVAKPQSRDPIARQSGNIKALEIYRAMRRDLSHDGFDRR